jgi:hypothetical protein
MASRPQKAFGIAIDGAALLCLRGLVSTLSHRQRQVHYHASLAASVAAWEAYLEAIVREFLAEISDPTDARFTAVQQLLASRATVELKRFNTPNAENSRNLVYNLTGYDPINDWHWPRRRLGGVATRQLVNEVIQVRHSFAHGYSMPAYGWNSGSGGAARLTTESLAMVRALFSRLTSATDRGLDRHIRVTYGRSRVWY